MGVEILGSSYSPNSNTDTYPIVVEITSRQAQCDGVPVFAAYGLPTAALSKTMTLS
jgi:hypothetical protein